MNALALLLLAWLSPGGTTTQDPVPQDPAPAEAAVEENSAQALPTEALQTGNPSSDEPARRVSEDKWATLYLWNREIVAFRASYREATPSRRVQLALDRIEALNFSSEPLVEVLEARIGVLEGFIISASGSTIFGLVAEDLDPHEETTLAAAAEEAAEGLRVALTARMESRRLPLILRGALFSGIATLIFGVLLRLLGVGMRRIVAWIGGFMPNLSTKQRLGGLDVRGSLEELNVFFVRLTSLAIALGLSYLWLTFCLSQFPYTQPWGEELGTYLVGALRTLGDGALASLPGLFIVFIIFAVTRMGVRLLNSFFYAVDRGQVKVGWLERETARATRRIVVLIVWLFAIMLAYPYIPGSSTAAFKGLSVFVGLMMTVGSSGLVNQIMSGLVVLYSRTLKAGDYVRIEGDEGIVIGVGFLSTRIATPTQEEIIIPNAVLTGKTTRNLTHISEEEGVTCTTKVTIGYDTPWRQVESLLTSSAADTEGIRKAPAPFVLQRELSDFYIVYELVFHLERPDRRAVVLSNLHRHILDAFNEADVQIMSPHFRGQPEQALVVPRAQWMDDKSPKP